MDTDVGILIALPWELKPLTGRKLKVGECRHLTKNIRVCLTGIGTTFVRSACARLMDDGVRLLISWGTAAALETDVKAGLLLLPDQIYSEGRPTIETDKAVQEFVKKTLPPSLAYSERPLFTSNRLIESSSQKMEIGERTNAVAADMESWHIANIAQEKGVDFLAIRAVSDTVDIKIPPAIADNISANGNVLLGPLFRHLIKNPYALLPVTKLYLGFTQAKKSLAEAAGHLLPALSGPQVKYHEISKP